MLFFFFSGVYQLYIFLGVGVLGDASEGKDKSSFHYEKGCPVSRSVQSVRDQFLLFLFGVVIVGL